VRSHPVLGVFLLLLGIGLFSAGLFGNWSEGPLANMPLPASIVVPFVLWQLALWCGLFGVFFLRSRGRATARQPRFAL